MYLYKFTVNSYSNFSIIREVLEVEEKPKIYITTKAAWKTRISKSDVGVINGYNMLTVYLLEDDKEKAREILVESLKSKVEKEKSRIEHEIKSSNERIAKYEKGISILLNPLE